MTNKIMLIITEDCNMNCVYCYEHKKNHNTMPFEVAVKIVENRLQQIKQGDEWTICFFGGEPFLNFSLIERVDQYIQQQHIAHYRSLKYSLITNGTVLSPKIKEWLIHHKNMVRLQLSLDGYQQIHDRNRPMTDGSGSFKRIDLDFFRSLFDRLMINTVVSPQSVPELSSNMKWMTEQGFDCRAEFAIGVNWKLINYKQLWEQLEELVGYYSYEKDHALPCLFLRKNMLSVYLPYNESFRPCGVCREDSCYDTQGRIVPCNGMSFVSVGDKTNYFSELRDKDFIFSEENICRKCEYVRVCKTCFAANYYYSGDINQQSPDLCLINKMCILASAEIVYNRLKGKLITNDNKLRFENSKRVINDIGGIINLEVS